MLFALEKSRRNKLHPREVRLDNDDRLLRRSIISQVQTMLTLLDMIFPGLVESLKLRYTLANQERDHHGKGSKSLYTRVQRTGGAASSD